VSISILGTSLARAWKSEYPEPGTQLQKLPYVGFKPGSESKEYRHRGLLRATLTAAVSHAKLSNWVLLDKNESM